MSYSEILKEENNFRVKLINDEYASEPWDDGHSPLIRIERRYSESAEHVMVGSRPTGDDDRIAEAAARWSHPGDHAKFEKYLRAYYAVTQVKWYGPNDATDSTYVSYDTAAWREYVGAPEKSVNMDEWISYLEGDVYGYRVERKVHVYQDKRIHSGDDFRTESTEYDEWEEVDSCWGFYGHEYATEAAEEALSEALNDQEVST